MVSRHQLAHARHHRRRRQPSRSPSSSRSMRWCSPSRASIRSMSDGDLGLLTHGPVAVVRRGGSRGGDPHGRRAVGRAALAEGRLGARPGPDDHDVRAGPGVVPGRARPRRRLAVRGRRPGRRAGRRRAGRPRQPSSTGSPPSGCRCSGSSRPASMPAARRRTSGSRPTARSCSSRRSAPTSAAPTCSSVSTARSLPHHFGDERPFDSLRRSVEHEAFVALNAPALGIRTPAFRAFATAEPNGYVLAYEAIAGRSLDRLQPSEVSDEVLAATWALVGALREHRIAHRDLRLANVFVDDGGDVWLIDFGFSEVAASDLLLATDVAELVASSSACVGRATSGRPCRASRRRGDVGAARSTASGSGASAARRERRSSSGRGCSTSCGPRSLPRARAGRDPDQPTPSGDHPIFVDRDRSEPPRRGWCGAPSPLLRSATGRDRRLTTAVRDGSIG